MRFLITGAAGRLGHSLLERLKGNDLIGADVAEFDIADFAATRAFIAAAQPDVVIHGAAWTDVDGCAREPEKALRINGLGSQNVALAAASVSAAVVYVSSNEVFSGESSRPYHEYDTPAPVNSYGYSKWVGEQVVTQATRRHYVVRTSWLFAHGGRNFIHVILHAAREGRPLHVVRDEIACPTYCEDLADGIARLIETERYGTYHLVNEGFCSRYDFARYILDRGGLDTPVEPITLDQWKRDSIPPRFSPLRNLAGATVGITLRGWQQAVNAFLEREAASLG